MKEILPTIIGSFAAIIALVSLSRVFRISKSIKREYNDENINNTNIIEDHSEKEKSNIIQSFLWWCSGARIEVLKSLPSESSKYIAIGSSVLLTAIFATLSGYFIIESVVKNNYFSILIAILWGGSIFTLDRFLVSSIQARTSSRFNDLIRVIPRLILAIMIGVLIAKPIEIKLFEPEIEKEIIALKTKKLLEISKPLELEILEYSKTKDSIKQKISILRKERDALEREFYNEVNNQSSPGIGAKAKLSRERINRNQYEISKLTEEYENYIEQLYMVQNSLKIQIAEKRIELDKNESNFIEKLMAVESFKEQNKEVYFIYAFILLLIILIESLPILMKFLTARGPYDIIVERLEELEISKFKEELSKEKTVPNKV